MSTVEILIAGVFFVFILITMVLPDELQKSKIRRRQVEHLMIDIEYERLVEDYWRS